MKKKKRRIKLDEPKNPAQTANYSPQNGALAPSVRPGSQTPVNPRTGMVPNARTPFPAAYGAMSSSPSGNVTIAGDNSEDKESAFQTGAKQSLTPVGNSGTQIFGGYFSEDYLHELRGRNGARKWDEIRRSEAQVAMLLNAITNPIKAANWDVEPYDSKDAESVKQAELCKAALFEMIDFNTFKHEALTFLPFGFSMFEVVHSVELDHPKFGTFNGLKALAFRSQKTIENWSLENKTGRLLGANQYTYSDLGGNEFLPGEFLLVFTNSKEGDNYEGISVLRPMYGAYKRKELYLKLAAIGVERYAIGTPIGTVPKGKEKSTEYGEFKKILQNYTSHESSYITKAEGWGIEIQKGDFDAEKIKSLIVLENTEMANSLVANFLALGLHGGGGALALGSNLQEFFTTGIQSYGDLVCDGVNQSLFPNLVKLNYGPQRGYPKLKVTGISDKAGKELAETIKFLTDARAIVPDDQLKEHLRKLYKLPKQDASTAIGLPVIPAGASANYPKPNDPITEPATGKTVPFNPNQLDNDASNDKVQAVEINQSIQLADKKYVKQFDADKQYLKEQMQEQLRVSYASLRDKITRMYKQAPANNKLSIAKDIKMPGLTAYVSLLKECMSEIAMKAVKKSWASIPKRALKMSEFDDLPLEVKRLITARARLIGESQFGDLEKISAATFTSEALDSEDIADILHEIDASVEPMIEGGTSGGMNVDAAAGNAVSELNQQASLSVFLDDEVKDGIESFTFTNEDPISEICTSLEGSTFAIDDPDFDTYTPPLHHNCKSRWVPNFKGDDGNPEIGSGKAQSDNGLSLTKKALDSITLNEKKK